MVLQIVILAAGQGKRMSSMQPKVLHQLAGKPLIEHVLTAALRLAPNEQPIVIYGHQGELLQQKLAHYPVQWVQQKEQLGTGHALLQAMPKIPEQSRVLVLYGDVPLISGETLHRLLRTPEDALSFITFHLPNPTGYGRVQRDASGQVSCIVEEKDANDQEKQITEVNSGIYLVPARYLAKWLPALTTKNQQKEYYLTDIIPAALHDGVSVNTIQPNYIEEVLGVNDRVQLAALERFYQRQHADKLMRQGVTLMDPTRIDIRGELSVGFDVVLDVNVIIEGRVTLGDGCVIGPHTVLRNVTLGDRVEVRPFSHLDGAEVGSDSIIGPFARIRPGSVFQDKVHIGNFVEIKNSQVGAHTKINHLSYVGDSEVGKKVNIGAGTITCNYDGINKYRTIIHDEVFVGSGTQLVAPVTVGAGATIGAGSTITRDVPAYQLTLSRVPQATIAGWQRPDHREKK